MGVFPGASSLTARFVSKYGNRFPLSPIIISQSFESLHSVGHKKPRNSCWVLFAWATTAEIVVKAVWGSILKLPPKKAIT